MSRSLRKDIFRQIWHSPRRFVAILLIVMLGVSFFAGVRATCPDMRLTLDAYYDEYRASDIHLLSTYGFNDDDVAAVKEAVGDGEVQPAYFVDGFAQAGDNRLLIHFLSYSLENPDSLNQPVLMEGRLPVAADECVLDEHLIESGYFQIGDTLTVDSKEDEGITDSLDRLTYTVVGSVRSTYYISVDRGSSSKGTGSLSGFAFLPEENFSSSVYTDLYLTSASTAGLSRFEDAYKDQMEALTDRLEAAGDTRNPQRLQELREEIDSQLEEARAEVEKGEQELADGAQQLEEARQEVEDGIKALEEQEQTYEEGIQEAKEQLDAAKEQLDASLTQLNESQQQLNDGQAELATGRQTLEEKQQQWNEGQESLQQLEMGIAQLEQTLAALPEGAPQEAALRQQLEQLQAQYDTASDTLESGARELEQGWAQWEESNRQLQEAQAALEEGREQYESGLAAYEDNLAQWETSKEDGSRQLEEGRSQLEQAQQELADAQQTWDEESAEAEQKLADARAQIADGEEQRDALEEPQWIVLDLERNAGFVSYEQDTDRVAAIGRVFPLIFFLVAALVSLTNMTRMVEDDRAVIGLYKALGYGRMAIALKYLVYAGMAAVGGIVLGLLWGEKLFPWIIADAYGILYSMPPLLMPYNGYYSLMAALGALICVVIPAFAVCQKELFSTPASLMRPRAPKEGKRILLERIKPVWKHLNFSKKVTCRNIFRYKKRLLMTILGIAGCTALVFTGFGLRESIQSIVGKQYDEIQKYDMQAGLPDGSDEERRTQLDEFLDGQSTVEDHRYFLQKSLDVITDEGMKSAYLLVPEDLEGLDRFITLRDRKSQEAETLSDDGIIVTEKLCSMLGIEVGDTIQLKDADNQVWECTVSGITENYVQHYLYMSPALYQKLSGSVPEMNTVLGQLSDTSEEAEDALSSALIAQDLVSSVSFNTSIRQNFSDMISAMDIVVVVLILSAAALAFIVLFSLTTINIDERRRELATLKVLGFYDRETSMYIYRENGILTVLGVLFGLLFGAVLLAYIITTVEVDMVMFDRTVGWTTYVLATVMTIFFSLLVNLLMNRVIRKIDMVESMKSVE